MPRKTKENPLGLEAFQGCPVVSVGIEINNAAGGLRDPLEVDKTMIDEVAKVTIGDRVFFLLACDAVKVRYQPLKGEEDKLKYVPVFRCTDATMIEGKWAAEAIADQRDRVQKAKEEAEGISRLFEGDGNDGEN